MYLKLCIFAVFAFNINMPCSFVFNIKNPLRLGVENKFRASNTHPANPLPQIAAEVLAAQHLDVLKQPEDKAPHAQIAAHLYAQEPVLAVGFGRYVRLRLGIFLRQQTVSQSPQPQLHWHGRLAAEGEDVGVDAPVGVLMLPVVGQRHNRADSGDFERLVLSRAYLVAANLVVAVEKHERLHHTVGHRVTMGRGVVTQDDRFAHLDGLIERRHVVGGLLAQVDIVEYVEVVERVELAFEVAHVDAAVVHSVEKTPHGDGFILGEMGLFYQFLEKRRTFVETVACPVFLDDEAVVAEKIQIVVEAAARYAEPFAELCDGISPVFGHEQYERQLTFKVVVAHGRCCWCVCRYGLLYFDSNSFSISSIVGKLPRKFFGNACPNS